MANREQHIAISFLAYNSANENMRDAGGISGENKRVFDQMGEVVKAIVTLSPNISDGEVMSLLTKAGDFAMLLCGALDSDKGLNTHCGKYYRSQVLPLLQQLLKQEVISEESLPKGVAKANAKTVNEVDPAFAKFKDAVGL